MNLYKWFYFCSCVQIRNWFDYRNHICIVSICVSVIICIILCSDSLEIYLNLIIPTGIREAWTEFV